MKSFYLVRSQGFKLFYAAWLGSFKTWKILEENGHDRRSSNIIISFTRKAPFFLPQWLKISQKSLIFHLGERSEQYLVFPFKIHKIEMRHFYDDFNHSEQEKTLHETFC